MIETVEGFVLQLDEVLATEFLFEAVLIGLDCFGAEGEAVGNLFGSQALAHIVENLELTVAERCDGVFRMVTGVSDFLQQSRLNVG